VHNKGYTLYSLLFSPISKTRVLAPALDVLRVAHYLSPGLSNCLFSDDVADAKLIKAFVASNQCIYSSFTTHQPF